MGEEGDAAALLGVEQREPALREPAIAPDAPTFGTLAPAAVEKASVTTLCTRIATRPAAMYQRKKRTGPSASSTLFPKIQRKSMFPRMWVQLTCRNIELNALSYQGRWWTSVAGATHGPSTEHG